MPLATRQHACHPNRGLPTSSTATTNPTDRQPPTASPSRRVTPPGDRPRAEVPAPPTGGLSRPIFPAWPTCRQSRPPATNTAGTRDAHVPTRASARLNPPHIHVTRGSPAHSRAGDSHAPHGHGFARATCRASTPCTSQSPGRHEFATPPARLGTEDAGDGYMKRRNDGSSGRRCGS